MRVMGHDIRVVTSDWAGNKTYVMEFDWSKGEVGEKMELADVEWPTKIKMTSASKSTGTQYCEKYIK